MATKNISRRKTEPKRMCKSAAHLHAHATEVLRICNGIGNAKHHGQHQAILVAQLAVAQANDEGSKMDMGPCNAPKEAFAGGCAAIIEYVETQLEDARQQLAVLQLAWVMYGITTPGERGFDPRPSWNMHDE